MSLTKDVRFDDTTIAILRNQLVWSPDGLSVTMPQLDRKNYDKVAKALEILGGKWNRKAKATLFDVDPRPQINGLVTRGALTVHKDGFFRTPRLVTQRMMSYMSLGTEDYTWLEPEAGDGAIIDALIKEGYPAKQIYAIEKEPRRCQIIRESYPGVHIACGDFLKFRNSVGIRFTRIIMNPPFEEGQDMEHIRKAYTLLARGGVMGAILGEGAFFRQDKKAETFRKWLVAVGAYNERLPEGSFKESGTSVNTRLIVVEKV
jgi:hypothetical protein